MPVWRVSYLALWFAAISPLSAQSELDLTEPTQAEEQDDQSLEQDREPEAAEVQRPQSIQPPVGDANTSYSINAIVIAGNEAVPDTSFIDVIETFTARPLSQADLSALADAVAQRARENGFLFATATIPQQNLALGMLRVELDEGRIDEIRIDGADDPAIRRQLAPLRSGKPITKAELERQILLTDDISGVRVLDTRFVKEGDLGVLIVRTSRSDAWASVEVRNNGSDPVGPVRAQIEVDLNGVFDSADEIDLTFGTTPLQPEELQYAFGSYRIVVDASGLELGAHLSYSHTQPGAFLEDRDISGRFWRAGVDMQYPLIRRRGASVWLIGEFEVADLRQDRADVLARHDRVPALRAGIYSRGRLAGGDYRGRAMVSRGLDILSATKPDDPLASRLDASAQFTSLYGWFAWERDLSGPLSIAIGARGQLATDPLLATEDLGLGGTSFLRGYNFNERSGDEGVMGFGELRYDWRGDGFWLPRAQLYAFADGGIVSNLEDGRGGGSLASAGGGLRLDLTRDLDLDLELAVPLSGERFDSESEAPLLNIRIEQSF